MPIAEGFCGGPATNAAITCSNLGGKAALVIGIGRHRFGDLIREELDRYSVILREIAPEFEGVPAVSSVTIDNAGRRSFVSANANRISVQHNEVDRELLGSTSVLMVDGHFMEVCRTWAEAAHGIGIKVVLDGGSWKPGLEKLLPHVHTAIR